METRARRPDSHTRNETLLVPFLTPIDPLEYGDTIQAFREINAEINPIEALESLLLGESVKRGGANTRAVVGKAIGGKVSHLPGGVPRCVT